MFSSLIALIYLAFIALGLPDSLLGSAWPVVSVQFGVDKGLQGLVTMIIAGGTILSSLLSDKLTSKFGTGVVTSVSVAVNAVALFGFSFSTALWQMCLWAIPYGLGAGAVDAALNNYAAVNFSSRHLNWLHCFWGVGACVSPYVMGACLTTGLGWNNGYRIVGCVLLLVAIVLFASLGLWKKCSKSTSNGESVTCYDDKCDIATVDDCAVSKVEVKRPLAIRGVWQTLLIFFCYCGAESIAMNWSSTYLVYHRGVDTELAATFASLFFIGITLGRFLCGVFSDKLGDKLLIRLGATVMLVGVVAIVLPLDTDIVALVGLVVFGFGCAPVYPAIIHMTPSSFGVQNSQKIVGLQMASAYLGTTFMPPLYGAVASSAMQLFPLFLGGFSLIMFAMSEIFNKTVVKN